MRPHLNYSDRTDVRAAGFDPDLPIAGYYRIRLRSGAAYCGVRVWFGLPLDPVTGEELDRSPRWQAVVNDEPVLLERVWPKCAAEPVDAAKYRHLCATQKWALEHAPETGLADLTKPLDPLTTPLMF